MEKLRIMSVFGTRPEAIKMAPLVKELASRDEIESLCCVTAQHREMLDSVMEVFDLKADCDLDIMTPRQTLSTITSKCLLGMDDAIEQLKPDMILVHGDTSTTFAGALSAFYHKVPVGHVEAGLRTYDKYSPFPEEMNRKLVTAIADLYFCPTKNNRENLLKEGVTEGLFITGNTVIDALKTTVRKDYSFTTELLNELDYSRKVVLVTCHRRENYGQPMENIMTALRDIALQNEDCELVYPVHLSPVVRENAQKFLAARAFDRPAERGRDAQSYGALLHGDDRQRRTPGGGSRTRQARPCHAQRDRAPRGGRRRHGEALRRRVRRCAAHGQRASSQQGGVRRDGARRQPLWRRPRLRTHRRRDFVALWPPERAPRGF